MMKTFFPRRCLVASLLGVLSLHTITTAAQGLQIGDKVPDVEIKRILNYKSGSESLKNLFGDKSLLIDFWFVGCSSCFESFPTIDSIQQEFKDDLNVLLVSYESKEATLRAFAGNKRVSHIKLPSAVSDTLLALMFPHYSAPHEIWIDKNGIVRAITDHRSITRENIRAFISGKELNLPLKKDNMEYVFELPLIATLDLHKTIKYNYFSPYHKGIPSSIGMYVNPENGYLTATVRNGGLSDLYILAYGNFATGFNYSRLVMEESVRKRFEQPDDSVNVFCYENWWLDTTRSKALAEMQDYLDRTLGLSSYTEKRKMPCIVLREAGSQKRYREKQSTIQEDPYVQNDTLYINGVYLKYLIENSFNFGRFSWSPHQFIDETGYEGKVTIALPARFESIAQVNQLLKNYDLEVILEDRWLDVVVIGEDNKEIYGAQ